MTHICYVQPALSSPTTQTNSCNGYLKVKQRLRPNISCFITPLIDGIMFWESEKPERETTVLLIEQHAPYGIVIIASIDCYCPLNSNLTSSNKKLAISNYPVNSLLYIN